VTCGAWFRCAVKLLAALIVTGCQGRHDSSKIRLQLNWFPDAQFGGYFAAQIHGEYAAEGLDVEIVPGGPGVAVIPGLASGRVQFGVGNADQVLLARQEGGKVVAVMTVMQDSPRCILVHESSSVDSFEELRDMTLAVEEGHAFAQYLKSHAKLENVRIVPYAGSIARFLLESDFAQQGYVFSEPLVARRQGSDPRALMLADIGFNPYTGVIMTTDTMIDSQPEVVRKFVRATRRGWQQYLESPAEANAEMHRRNPEMDMESLEEAVKIIRGLCLPRDMPITELGIMNRARWNELAAQLRELGMLRDEATIPMQACSLDFL
jgi:NitT/TauT family transport system substrate-binding protein